MNSKALDLGQEVKIPTLSQNARQEWGTLEYLGWW
jgi:hypothetical protein